ncbi:hypothetical protein F528_0718 [Neisseria meningitidis 992008]|uniref:Uncharacterized protein n=3 Tax=Neisseria meningitidis TaxID=487 RepID=X5EHQ6_NEIME|nr:hypothetical protein NMA510612_0908 [Neisseria meningitidis]KER40284.1 hypothetical protein F528_0718 [Neisseria meningitidis 992008]CBA07194.1 hypothetical protein predicted by Glimmer/Critica [Neisseria meningitidis alpha153]CCA45251.1 hypothetical protein NMALPHA522_1710 [Neisseria meningitidis alpha522]
MKKPDRFQLNLFRYFTTRDVFKHAEGFLFASGQIMMSSENRIGFRRHL